MTSTTPILLTEYPEVVEAQLDEARHRLGREATAAGVAEPVLHAAFIRAVDRYRDAHVHAFIGVLVEREVRDSLGLRRAPG